MSGALEGLRVLDFSRLLPGPYCTWLLADMGAEVIRIENPREVRKQAAVFGWEKLSGPERRRIRQQDILGRNKQSVMLDIGDPDAQQALRKLAEGCDVLVEDYRPGVLAGLGLGHDDLAKVNPALVYCSVTLCGQTGPYRDKPGHDPVALSIAGVMSCIGENPDEPAFSGIPAADIVTGTHAAFGVLAALAARDRTGKGQHVDVAMTDCAMTLLANVLSRHPDPAAIPPRGTRRADMGLWRTSDGKFVCTTDMEPRYWAIFCQTVGKPEFVPLQNDVSARPMIRAELERIFAAKTQAEWLEILESAGTQFAPVLDIGEALANEHNRARGMVVDLATEDGTVRQLGTPVKLTATPGTARTPAHSPGADTRQVLEALDLPGVDVSRLIASTAGLAPVQ
ncbi:CaiB/BaiF CoA-transferase family protein [Oricola sp.]|uniref:CaiB/BaiF CoA transferase family protein n=1 Tax=Oricola sp. TaxID=1979950 RepID=UPI0025E4554F|nr:CaiB/BaiF CoA-transferase family protein [Oricola sp.]MCI5078098.1 CoA transferase [Oricola sp.]